MFANAVLSAVEVAVAVVSSPVVIGVAAVAAVAFLAYAGYRYYESTHAQAPSRQGDSSGKTKAKPKRKPTTFPQKPADMDKVLNVPGKKVKDGPKTKGRNKTKWKFNPQVTVTHESHPYHPTAPIEHRGPHYHVEAPNLGFEHERFLPGDPLSDIFK